MSSELQPALTAEEWAAGRFSFEYWGEAHAHSTGEITVRDVINSPAIVKGDDRKKMAALCLHGQPYGFTWEDVQWLRELSSWMERNHPPVDQTEPEWYDDLADRIAALLPPREQFLTGRDPADEA